MPSSRERDRLSRSRWASLVSKVDRFLMTRFSMDTSAVMMSSLQCIGINLKIKNKTVLNVGDVEVWHCERIQRWNSKLRNSVRHHLLQKFQDLLEEIIHGVPDSFLLGQSHQAQ